MAPASSFTVKAPNERQRMSAGERSLPLMKGLTREAANDDSYCSPRCHVFFDDIGSGPRSIEKLCLIRSDSLARSRSG